MENIILCGLVGSLSKQQTAAWWLKLFFLSHPGTGSDVAVCFFSTGGLFPTGSHEYEVFRFALAQHQDIPKLVPQVDMVDTASSFSMTYACEFAAPRLAELSFLFFFFFFLQPRMDFLFFIYLEMLRLPFSSWGCDGKKWWIY